MKRRSWSASDIRTLKRLAGKRTRAASIARTLKRTEGATRQKAFSLGLSLETRVGRVCQSNVRFTSESRHRPSSLGCPLCAKSIRSPRACKRNNQIATVSACLDKCPLSGHSSISVDCLERRRYVAFVGLGVPHRGTERDGGEAPAALASLPGFDSPTITAQESGTSGGRRQSRQGQAPKAALLFVALAQSSRVT